MRPFRSGRDAAAVLLGALALAACEPGSKNTAQIGYRGVGMEQVSDPDRQRVVLASNTVPDPLPPAPAGGPAAQWQNVKILNDVGVAEFTRTMTAMTNWVAPKEGKDAGCAYCHNLANLASDEKYPKVVARRMLAMTRDINANWRSHVGQTGVTCYTCHAGNAVPRAGLWTYTDQNQYLRAYLDKSDLRVQTQAALPASNRSSIKQTEYTYAVMINMSNSLGVNCGFCHNSRAWSSWQDAPPTRVTAQYGLRMTRYLNAGYVAPLGSVLPASRLGERGDAPKVGCATCHNGVHKPLAGAKMAKDYPALWGHQGPWESQLPSDTARNGIQDLRGADRIPNDGTGPLIPQHAPNIMPQSRPIQPGAAARSASVHSPATVALQHQR